MIAEDFSSPRSATPGAGVSARTVTLLLSVAGASAEFSVIWTRRDAGIPDVRVAA